MGEGRVSLTPCADFYRPVEALEYTDLLRSTFTQSDHERGLKTWRTPATHPQCAFCGKKYRWGKGEVVPYQQLLDDKELIVDKVVLINKQP